MKTKLQALYPADWVLIGFFIFSLTRLLLSPNPLDWSHFHFSFLPVVEFLYIPIAVFILRFYRKRKILLTLNLILLVFCFYGYKTDREAFVRSQEILSPAFLDFLFRYRAVSLFCLLGLQVFSRARYSALRLFSHSLRIIYPFYCVILLYPFMPLIIQASNSPDADPMLQASDRFLFGGQSPHFLMQSLINPSLSEWMAFVYSFFILWILIVFAFLYLKKRAALEEFAFMMTFSFALGYIFYTIVPAKGPMYTEAFTVSLDLHYLKGIKEGTMDQLRIERDCFPSLHTALSLICLYLAWKHLKKVFWTLLPIVILIPVACVYLRFHYVTDVLAGALLSILTVFVSKRLPSKQNRPSDCGDVPST